MPNPRLLILLLVACGAMVGGALGARMGKPIAFVGGVFGGLFGWTVARAIWRKLF